VVRRSLVSKSGFVSSPGGRYADGVNELLIGLISAMVSTNPVVAASNVVAQTTGIHVPVTDPNDRTRVVAVGQPVARGSGRAEAG